MGNAFEFRIEEKGLDKVLGNFQRLPREMQQAIWKAVDRSLQDVASEGKIHARVKTGHFRASIGGSVQQLGINEIKMVDADIVGRMGTNVVYAPFLEFGTKFMRAFHTLENAARAKASDVVKRIADAVGTLTRKL